MLGPILNAHKNVKLRDSGGVWRRLWGLMEKDGTYIVAGVMVGGGRWYLRCFICFFFKNFYFYIFEVLDGLCVWIEL